MNYSDKRYSPGADRPAYNYRAPTTPHTGGPDYRSQQYAREYPPLRSRSHTNVDIDYNDRYPSAFVDNRALDRTSRSKSLDHRDAFRDDGQIGPTGGTGGPSGGVIIPIKRDPGRARTFDVRASPLSRPRDFERQSSYEREQEFRDRREIQIPYNRDTNREPNRDFGREHGRDMGRDASRDFNRRSGYEENRIAKVRDPYVQRDGDSPKSFSSRHVERRNRDHEFGVDRDRGYPEDFGRDDFREAGGTARAGGGAGGYRSSSGHHRAWHETYGGGGQESSYGPGPSRIVNQQPGPHSIGPGNRPVRPIQHHRVQCCCFNFVWPPWSYETAAPPQQIYRNF